MGAKKGPEGYINATEAAKLCGVCAMTMYRWLRVKEYIPYITVQIGSKTFWYVREQDARKLAAQMKDTTRRQRHKEYEIVMITLGQVEVLFKTDSLYELSRMYTKMMEHQHKLVRIRADGELLTIHDSDRLGYTYHPRTKARAV